jgi:hypothetical protein
MSICRMLTFACALAFPACAFAAAPRGQVAELHSCEVYAGGCIVSAEATMGGRYVLRAWHFESGRFQGIDLAGLSLALLEVGSENLADRTTTAERAVVYIPENVSAPQRGALVAWAKAGTAAPIAASDVRSVPMTLQITGDNVDVALGRDITFSGTGAPACGLASCGEMLWYEPRSAMTSFTVDQLTRSRIVEPALALQWQDHGRRTLFLGRFGDPEITNPTGLCGAPLAIAP